MTIELFCRACGEAFTPPLRARVVGRRTGGIASGSGRPRSTIPGWIANG